jgi:argininosuccinate synthase
MDANLLHISYEGDILEDPWAEPEEDMWRWTVSPEDAPDKAVVFHNNHATSCRQNDSQQYRHDRYRVHLRADLNLA